MGEPDESVERLKRILRAKEREDTGFLIEALRDDENRFTAAKFLADLGCEEAVPALQRMLDANDTDARRLAVIALGRLGAREAVPRLREVVQADPDTVIRAWAIASLCAIGGEGVLALASSYLNDPEWVMRRGAAFSLGVLGDSAAIPLLKLAKKHQPWSRRGVYRKAIKAIKTGKPLSIEPDPNPRLLERIAMGLASTDVEAPSDH